MTVLPKGLDYNKTIIGNQLVGLYYYTLDKYRMSQNNGEHSSIFSYVPTIQSINFNPFVDVEDNFIDIVPCDFDDTFFGKPNATENPLVYRLKDFNSTTKDLGSYTLKINKSELGADFETRLLFYPFKYYMLCDYLNPPIIMKPEFLQVITGKIYIRVHVALSQTSKYNLYCEGYKKDSIGNIEGTVNNNPLLYPVGSSAYASFLATQGNSFNQSNFNALAENDLSYKQNVESLDLNRNKSVFGNMLGGIGSILSGNIGGGVNSGSNIIFDALGNRLQRQFNEENTAQKEYNIESMALARKNDYLNTPRTMKTMGNDATFNISLAHQKVDILEYGLHPTYENRLKNYFKRYGYRVDRYGTPHLRTRRYWNFVKMSRCIINNPNIPLVHKNELQRIFESGITLWHVTDGATMKDYSVDNLERS